MTSTTSNYAFNQNYHNTPPFHHHIDLPPRKLNFTFTNPNFFTAVAEQNHGEHSDEDPDDPYSSDYFRIYEFKVRKCTRSRSHDWTDCPFAHPGEKARRRDPRRYNYSGEICPEFRLTGGGGGGACAKGERCELSHGVFECWLHPDRYRTEPCKDGVNCTRKVCFFAHTPQQLRFSEKLPEIVTPTEKKLRKTGLMANSKKKHCCKCVYCLHNSINLSSPTSTLTGAPHFSPPASPSPPVSPDFRKFGDKLSDSVKCDLLRKYCYEDVVNELMSSMETMNVSGNGNGNGLWVDVGKDQELDFSGFNQNWSSGGASSNFDDGKLGNENGLSCPDLGWVNDLLM